MCVGACGAVWQRAVMDSNDVRRAHWHGACGLPQEEQIAKVRAWLEAERAAKAAAPAPGAAPVPIATPTAPAPAPTSPRPAPARPAPRDAAVQGWLARTDAPEVRRLHAHLVARFDARARSWSAFKESLGVDVHACWDDYDLAKGNARFATVALVTLRELALGSVRSPAELLEAGADILATAPEDPDYDPPRPVQKELAAVLDGVWRDGLP
jgi:hypothetical protein